jgi:hypothetical protein
VFECLNVVCCVLFNLNVVGGRHLDFQNDFYILLLIMYCVIFSV